MKGNNLYYIYIMASNRNGTTYIGMTNSIFTRVAEHKSKKDKNSFTAIHNILKLVYFETYNYVEDAISREKQLKGWNRDWKIKLIEKENKTWRDLYFDMLN